MINLSKRLKCISECISESDNVLDIGCDHALLDIYLSKKYNKKYYASDIKQSALDIAKENIKKYSANDVILKCGNGLEVLEKNIDTIVISGLGDISIINILKDIKNINHINKLVIESNNNSNNVRKFLLKNGFIIDYEKVVLDNNFYYIISVFKRGLKKYSKIDKEIGILTGLDLDKYYEYEIKKNKVLLNLIPKKYLLKRIRTKRTIKYLNKKKLYNL